MKTAMLKNARELIGVLWLVMSSTACGNNTTQRLHLAPLQPVAHVDLARYLGTWFEISSFPQRFQQDCTGTTATYTLRDDGDIEVLNRCRKDSLDGEEKVALGRARVLDSTTNAKLEVSFFRPFWGDYWIIDVADDYTYAVVGHPGRDYLWILSRASTMTDEVYQGILSRVQAQGYETDRLVRTLQVARPSTDSAGAITPRSPESK